MNGYEFLSSVCIKCHAGYAHTGNHRIEVLPPENVTIPVDYSMSSDGCITCVTCHASHASNNEARLRFRYKYGEIKAGSYADATASRAEGGCFVCHADKGVSPKNRLI